MKRILVVEDDLMLSTGLCFELDTAGYITQAAYNCKKAEYLVKQEAFSLVILDVNLPDGNGFDLCRKVKETHPELPVIFLTAKDLEEDVLSGYDLGAEDYITKPFRMPILLKRVEVALRRGGGAEKSAGADCYRDDFLQIDFDALTVWQGGEKLSVTPNEYKLLRVLIANAGNVVTRKLLLEKLWDCDGNFIDDHTLTVTMNRLRAKIEDDAHSYIKTVRGMGYIWESRV
ncbi:MAG: response regulator transcription factor [Lachnospiraceae bacterium]|jgi:DNA-binding response OmpR family regulator|nr:response regulator transcription factor [Lachnospiraceae bacterium]